MIRLVNKARAILKDTHGESLMEGLASILVFTVLIATITMMIMVSLRITHNTTIAAGNGQIEAGAVLSGEGTVFDDPPEVIDSNNETISFTVGTGTPVNVSITVFSTESYTAFEPAAGP